MPDSPYSTLVFLQMHSLTLALKGELERLILNGESKTGERLNTTALATRFHTGERLNTTALATRFHTSVGLLLAQPTPAHGEARA